MGGNLWKQYIGAGNKEKQMIRERRMKKRIRSEPDPNYTTIRQLLDELGVVPNIVVEIRRLGDISAVDLRALVNERDALFKDVRSLQDTIDWLTESDELADLMVESPEKAEKK